MLTKIASRLLLVLLAIVFTVGILEIGFRLFRPQQHFSVHINTWDRELGHRNIPGGKGSIDSPEFKTSTAINSKGLRDREYPYEKPENTRRILCLGDSFTFGHGVEQHEVFPKVLENLLNQETGSDGCWEVINAGVDRTGTAHQLAYFNAEGYKYDPDLVLLCFCGANDFFDNAGVGLYRLQDGRLVKQDARLPDPVKLREAMLRLPGYRILSSRFHLFTFMRRRIANYIYSREVRTRDPVRAETAMPRAENLTRHLLTALCETCRAKNIVFAVMVVPHADGSDPPRQTASLIEFVKATAIPYVDLSARFLEEGQSGIENYFPLDGHWNPAGHRLTGRILKDFVVGLRADGEDAGPITQTKDERS
ncbi:MAG: hypothetical protein KAW17_11200 [Candidatus Eisenbacteria sp.]|nr:hypothetical protein [Candidatus Eisenbacteria bacterium]